MQNHCIIKLFHIKKWGVTTFQLLCLDINDNTSLTTDKQMTALSPRSLFLRSHTLKRKTDNLHIELDEAITQKSNPARHAAAIGQNLISVSSDIKVPALTGLPVVGIIICPELDTVLFQSRCSLNTYETSLQLGDAP